MKDKINSHIEKSSQYQIEVCTNIRVAKASDAAAIARVHIDSWRTTYVGIVPQDYLDAYSAEIGHLSVGVKGKCQVLAIRDSVSKPGGGAAFTVYTVGPAIDRYLRTVPRLIPNSLAIVFIGSPRRLAAWTASQ